MATLVPANSNTRRSFLTTLLALPAAVSAICKSHSELDKLWARAHWKTTFEMPIDPPTHFHVVIDGSLTSSEIRNICCAFNISPSQLL